MKKAINKIFAVFLCIMCLTNVCALFSHAATVASGKCGENVSWTLDSSGTLTISGKGDMWEREKFTGNWDVSEVKKVIIKYGVTSICNGAFQKAGLREVVLPESLTSIGAMAFWNCGLTSVAIPETVKYIGESAFGACAALREIVIPYSVTEMGEGVFAHCYSLQKASIRGRITFLDINVFYMCSELKIVELPSTLRSVGRRAFSACENLTDVYYEGTEAQWKKVDVNIVAGSNSELINATWHYNHDFDYELPSSPIFDANDDPHLNSETGLTGGGLNADVPDVALPGNHPVQNGYNRGEETYKFNNYIDFHFEGFDLKTGHCFGMAVTSSAYYTNLVNINERIGISDSSKLYAEAQDDHEFFKLDTNTHTEPICYYQDRQGSSFKKSVVAGGSWWLTKLTEKVDLEKDWNEVAAYIQDGSHNDKGDLILVYRGDVSGEHAVNFLRCEGQGDAAKIYVYDNNFPEDDNIYLYKENGKVYCNYSSGSPENIKSVSLCDIAKYLESADGFRISDVVYAGKGDIKVTYEKDDETVVTEEFPMIGCKDEMVLHEIEENVENVVITPLKDDAKFVYMGNTYTADADDTVELRLAESDEDVSAMKIEGKEKTVSLKKKASMTITPSVYVTEKYTVSYTSSDAKVVTVDEKGTVTAARAGKATVTCTVKDENGNVLVTDVYEITVTGSSLVWIIVIVIAAVIVVTAGTVTVIIIVKRKKKG